MARRGQVERTDDIIQRILDEVTDGRTLSSICDDPGMPTRRTVSRWLTADPDFLKRYKIAEGIQADIWFEKVVDTAEGRHDDEILQSMMTDNPLETANSKRHLLLQFRNQRIDAYKYAAGKIRPTKYGANQLIEVNSTVETKKTTVTRIELVAPEIDATGKAMKVITDEVRKSLPIIDQKVLESADV
jgi:hypothetical protein